MHLPLGGAGPAPTAPDRSRRLSHGDPPVTSTSCALRTPVTGLPPPVPAPGRRPGLPSYPAPPTPAGLAGQAGPTGAAGCEGALLDERGAGETPAHVIAQACGRPCSRRRPARSWSPGRQPSSPSWFPRRYTIATDVPSWAGVPAHRVSSPAGPSAPGRRCCCGCTRCGPRPAWRRHAAPEMGPQRATAPPPDAAAPGGTPGRRAAAPDRDRGPADAKLPAVTGATFVPGRWSSRSRTTAAVSAAAPVTAAGLILPRARRARLADRSAWALHRAVNRHTVPRYADSVHPGAPGPDRPRGHANAAVTNASSFHAVPVVRVLATACRGARSLR
ncbi:hypothetical protein HBB16_17250 [Pseudonocardia sp. MCCB 268]|nr:hypothetical protein [Pseudonocardia cytotoxica]